jgi:membrane fusion protein, multidrug efflux system
MRTIDVWSWNPIMRPTFILFRRVVLLGTVALFALTTAMPNRAQAPRAAGADGAAVPAFVIVRAANQPHWVDLEAVVEAVRETTLSAQVQGAIVDLRVKAGDRVRAGQVLLRIDAQAAQVERDVATREYERQRSLFDQQYISQGALDRAQAQARASQVQTDFYLLTAPYAGVVREVPVSLGDMAMPGRPLLTVYDPTALRVTAAVPQTLLAGLAADTTPRVRYELEGHPVRMARDAQLLPTVDPVTQTARLRFDLPKEVRDLAHVAPGMYVRVWLSVPQSEVGAGAGRIFVPATALVRRGEMTGVYVLDVASQPRLRQVRAGPVDGDRVEILSGVAEGDRVVIDAQRATRLP